MLKNKKILIVAAHPDDEILGCGGTIFKLKKNNKIKIIFLTNGVSARSKDQKKIFARKHECEKLFKFLKIGKPIFFDFPDNQLDNFPLLKIIKKIEKILKTFKPEIVFTHFEDCLNIDHQTAFKATLTACRPLKKISVKKILSFEVLSSTEWTASKKKSFHPNFYINIDNEIKKKIEALKFYKSELKKYPHSRSVEGIKTLAKFRGISSGNKYAEAFILVRNIES